MQQRILTCLFLLIICFFSDRLFAQAYHPFPSGHTYLYTIAEESPTGNDFFAAKVDSAKLEGADSAFYLYRIDRQLTDDDTLYSCNGYQLDYLSGAYLPNRDHCFGKKMLRDASGICRFVSSDNDTFLLKTWAAVGQSWNWQTNIIATVDSIKDSLIFGVADSVKYIGLSNGQQIQLSRHHGFVRSFSFLPLGNSPGPVQVQRFVCFGIPELQLGQQIVDAQRLFGQHQPGDQWIYRQFEGNLGAPGFGQGNYYRTVLQSAVPGSPNTFLALKDRVFFYAAGMGTVYATYFPAIQITHHFDSAHYSAVYILPYASLGQPDGTVPLTVQTGIRRSPIYNQRFVYSTADLIYYDSCAHAYITQAVTMGKTYVEGVGDFASNTYYEGGDYNNTDLECYHLGAEQWGTCVDLSTLVSNILPLEDALLVFPNPAQDRVFLRCDAGAIQSVDLMSLTGQLLQHFEMGNAAITSIPLDQIAPGYYYLHVVIDGLATQSVRLVVAR